MPLCFRSEQWGGWFAVATGFSRGQPCAARPLAACKMPVRPAHTLRSVPTLYTNPPETTRAVRENHGALSGEPGPAQGPESTWVFQKDLEVRPVLVLGPFFPLAQWREKQAAAPRSPSLWPTWEASDRAREAELKPPLRTQTWA